MPLGKELSAEAGEARWVLVGRSGESYTNNRELKLFAHAEHEAAGWLLEARLALGKLWETPWDAPGDNSGLYAWQLAATRDLTPMLRLRLVAGGSDSSAFLQGSGSGYTRNYLGASLIWFY